jgi:hypothetical protein
MAQVTEEKIDKVANSLWREVYECSFRGKERGRFAVTREQLKQALNVQKLHTATVEKLQESALAIGLIIIDLDDVFPCIETKVVRQYRRPPKAIWDTIFGELANDEDEASSDESDC